MRPGVLVERLRHRHAGVVTGPDGGDRGTTMVELSVGMILMLICGSIFTAGVVSLSQTSNQAQAVTEATAQTNRAYQTLERTVRYSAAISTPGQGTAAPLSWYVELRDTTDGSEVCTQLRLNTATGQLQTRTWRTANLATLTGWTTLAAGLTNGAAASGSTGQPFDLLGVGDRSGAANRQQLRVHLVSASGPANGRTSSTSSFTLTAINSTDPPPAGAICTQAGRP